MQDRFTSFFCWIFLSCTYFSKIPLKSVKLFWMQFDDHLRNYAFRAYVLRPNCSSWFLKFLLYSTSENHRTVHWKKKKGVYKNKRWECEENLIQSYICALQLKRTYWQVVTEPLSMNWFMLLAELDKNQESYPLAFVMGIRNKF